MSQVHHLMVATSRCLQVQSDTLLWIEEHFPGIFASSAVYFSGLWDTVHEGSHKLTKTELITQINADVLIDDVLLADLMGFQFINWKQANKVQLSVMEKRLNRLPLPLTAN